MNWKWNQGWLSRWSSRLQREKVREAEAVVSDKLVLLLEIRKAHADWVAARHKLNWVLEKDQIDCAIYDLEAAEKRYEMLLRQAKQYEWLDAQKVIAMEG